MNNRNRSSWNCDASDADVQWWTREGHAVGVLRTRDDELGAWGPYTIAYVDDGSPAGDAHYRHFDTLDAALEAASRVDREQQWSLHCGSCGAELEAEWDATGDECPVDGCNGRLCG